MWPLADGWWFPLVVTVSGGSPVTFVIENVGTVIALTPRLYTLRHSEIVRVACLRLRATCGPLCRGC